MEQQQQVRSSERNQPKYGHRPHHPHHNTTHITTHITTSTISQEILMCTDRSATLHLCASAFSSSQFAVRRSQFAVRSSQFAVQR
jgi:hypothetical protein